MKTRVHTWHEHSGLVVNCLNFGCKVPKSNRKSKHLSCSGNASRDRMVILGFNVIYFVVVLTCLATLTCSANSRGSKHFFTFFQKIRMCHLIVDQSGFRVLADLM